ncbi:MAG: hypothetical protein KDK39_10285 [Leptospiraceae bacterium]|nr:hypothetical protein [Leptospiraceae bacterium]
MSGPEKESIPERTLEGTDGKVLNFTYFRIKKSLEDEGFDLITDENGKLTVILKVPGR